MSAVAFHFSMFNKQVNKARPPSFDLLSINLVRKFKKAYSRIIFSFRIVCIQQKIKHCCSDDCIIWINGKINQRTRVDNSSVRYVTERDQQ